jgi:hypothetical protein
MRAPPAVAIRVACSLCVVIATTLRSAHDTSRHPTALGKHYQALGHVQIRHGETNDQPQDRSHLHQAVVVVPHGHVN